MVSEDLWIVAIDDSFAVQSNFHGIVSEGHDCRQSASDWIEEYKADQAAEAVDAERVAITIEGAQFRIVDEVQSFLRALDKGLLGNEPGSVRRFGDGTESAFITALRQAVAPFEARP